MRNTFNEQIRNVGVKDRTISWYRLLGFIFQNFVPILAVPLPTKSFITYLRNLIYLLTINIKRSVLDASIITLIPPTSSTSYFLWYIKNGFFNHVRSTPPHNN